MAGARRLTRDPGIDLRRLGISGQGERGQRLFTRRRDQWLVLIDAWLLGTHEAGRHIQHRRERSQQVLGDRIGGSGDSGRRHLASGHDHVASNRGEGTFVRSHLGQMRGTKPVQ